MKRTMIFGLLLGAIAAGSFGADNDGTFSYRLGQFEVHMLVDAQREGNTGILIDADQALLNRSIPAGGFMHSTNVFLIKTPEHTILIDTGFGNVIFDKMNDLGVNPEDIDIVLITHLHGDHIGGLQRNGTALFPNAKVYVAAREHEHFTRTQVNQGAVAALAAYGANVITFEPSELGSTLRELLPGITAIANYGHTPGHTVFLVQNGGARLIIAGDFLHVALVQFLNPDISATFDVNPAAAAASRRQILAWASANRIPIAGMHIVYPGIGTVEAEGNGYRFLPVR